MLPIAAMMLTWVAPESAAVRQKLEAENLGSSTKLAPAASVPASE